MKPYLIGTHKRFLYCSLERLVNQHTKETSIISQFMFPKIIFHPILLKLNFIVWNSAHYWKQWVCDLCYCKFGIVRETSRLWIYFFLLKSFVCLQCYYVSVLFWKPSLNFYHSFSESLSCLYLPATALLGWLCLHFLFFFRTPLVWESPSQAPAIQNSLLVSLLHCLTTYSKPQLKAEILFLAILISTPSDTDLQFSALISSPHSPTYCKPSSCILNEQNHFV